MNLRQWISEVQELLMQVSSFVETDVLSPEEHDAFKEWLGRRTEAIKQLVKAINEAPEHF